MLQLKNINIKFDREIITDSKINIIPGKITAITGDSGSGKTTLLYLIGLIGSNTQYEYFINGKKVNLYSDSEKSKIRKTEIGYVFQDNNLIENLSIKENIKLLADISGREIDSNEIDDLIQYVGLKVSNECFPRELSGGERQRLAIACALAKESPIIIADEPTSALDHDNKQLIIDLFKKIAYEKGKYVIIATHDTQLKNESDIIYNIKKNKIELEKSCTEYEKLLVDKTHNSVTKETTTDKLSFKFYSRYIKSISKRRKIQNFLLVGLCTIPIAISSLSSIFGEVIVQNQEKFMNEISDRELFLINATTPLSELVDYEENLTINEEDYEKLNSISTIEVIYPFTEFKSYGYNGEEYLTSGTIKVINSNKENNIVDFDLMDTTLNNSYSILPYYPHQDFEKKTKIIDENLSEGVFISSELARILNVELLQNTVLDLEINVPSKQFASQMIMNENVYESDLPQYKKINLTVNVKGVLEENVINNYSDSGNKTIYMDYKVMDQILIDNKEYLNETDTEFVEKDWGASSYIVVAEDYQAINVLKEKISNINPNFRIKSVFQDIELMNGNISNLSEIVSGVSIIILVIIVSLIAIIQMNSVETRKFEISILKANGLTKKEIQNIVLTETLYQVIYIACFASVISLGLLIILTGLTGTNFVINGIIGLFSIIITSIFTLFLPTIITIHFVNKYNPDEILRG